MLSMATLLVVAGATVLSTVFAGGNVGGAAFVATDADGNIITDEREQTLIFAATPTSAPGEEVATTLAPDPAVPAESSTTTTTPPTSTTSSSTTVLITADPGLHDMPNIETPLGYEVLDRWEDGPSRVTVWAAHDQEASRADLELIIAVGLGNWITIDSGEHQGSTWSKLIHASHPYCLWVEVYDAGRERASVEKRSDLQGQQFLVVETPFCDVQPGAFT